MSKCKACAVDLKETENNVWHPFCSERCKISDLGNWASERYQIKGKDNTANVEFDLEDSDS